MSGLVSIIMPAYNEEDYISIAIDSILAQTYTNWELIIVDDCSSDRTPEIVNKYKVQDERIQYYRLNENSGAAQTRNKAISHAQGKYMAFLDADDVWFNQKLEKQIEFMEDNNYNFTCTKYNKINENGDKLGYVVNVIPESDYNVFIKNPPGNSTVIYNLEKLGKYTIPNIRKRNDYVLWLQVIKDSPLYGLDEVLASHRVAGESLSSNKFNLVKYNWQVYREIEKLSLLKSIHIIIYIGISSIFKLRWSKE